MSLMPNFQVLPHSQNELLAWLTNVSWNKIEAEQA